MRNRIVSLLAFIAALVSLAVSYNPDKLLYVMIFMLWAMVYELKADVDDLEKGERK